MPDFTMCKNFRCRVNLKCKRYNSTPDYFQSYADFAPNENGLCDHYISLRGEQQEGSIEQLNSETNEH